MTVREQLERMEHRRLNPLAAFSDQSRGRPIPEQPREGDVRTCYQRDTDRIVHSKAFRRLMHKTQVFLQPEGDHYRTRMTHTLEVARIARTITRGLNLNEDLAEAIAMGHDLGHTPFGHAGEAAMAKLTGHFAHNEQSLRVQQCAAAALQEVHVCLLGFFLKNRFIQRNIGIQGLVLLSGCRLDGCDHLAVHTQLCKAAERSIPFFIIIPYSFIQTNHPFLDDILAVCADEEICSGFGTHQRFIFIQQIFLRCVVAILRHQHQFFIPCLFVILFFRCFCHKILSPSLIIFFAAGLRTMPAIPHPDDPPGYYFSAVCFR